MTTASELCCKHFGNIKTCGLQANLSPNLVPGFLNGAHAYKWPQNGLYHNCTLSHSTCPVQAGAFLWRSRLSFFSKYQPRPRSSKVSWDPTSIDFVPSQPGTDSSLGWDVRCSSSQRTHQHCFVQVLHLMDSSCTASLNTTVCVQGKSHNACIYWGVLPGAGYNSDPPCKPLIPHPAPSLQPCLITKALKHLQHTLTQIEHTAPSSRRMNQPSN